jgi:hypothetical protein
MTCRSLTHAAPRRDGSKFLNRLQVSPLYGRDGRVSHLLGVLTPEDVPGAACLAARRAVAGAQVQAEGGSRVDGVSVTVLEARKQQAEAAAGAARA